MINENQIKQISINKNNNMLQNMIYDIPISTRKNISKAISHQFLKSNQTKEKQILQKLFYIYSLNGSHLTLNQFLKLAKDLKITDHSFNAISSTLLALASTKQTGKISFDSLSEMIVKIAEIKLPETFIESQAKALRILFNQHITPLYKSIKESSSNYIFTVDESIKQLNSKEVISLIVEYADILRELYAKYFNDQYSNSAKESCLIQKDESALIQFGKDFDLFSKFITITKAKKIFKVTTLIYSSEIIETMADCPLMNEGNYYTLYHFITFLYLLAKNNADRSSMRKMMEYIVKKKEYKTLLLYFNNTIDIQIDSKATTRYHTRKNSFEMRRSERDLFSNRSNDDSSFKTSNELLNTLMKKYNNILITVYKYYSKINYERRFLIRMSKKGFSQFIIDTGLEGMKEKPHCVTSRHFSASSHQSNALLDNHKCKAISISNVTSLFNQCPCEYRNNNHINYRSFFIILLCIAYLHSSHRYQKDNKSRSIESFFASDITHNGKQKDFQVFIKEYIIPLYSGKLREYIIQTQLEREGMHSLNGEIAFKQFYDQIEESIYQIFYYYSKKTNQGKSKLISLKLPYEAYSEFMTDFELMPDLISKSKVMKYYIEATDNYEEEVIMERQCNENGIPSLSFDHCLNLLLSICLSTNLVDEDRDIMTNILYFLHKIMMSKGLKKITAQLGNSKLMNEIINMFNIYNQWQKAHTVKRGLFNDLMKE